MPRQELIRISRAKPPSVISRVMDAVRSYTIGPLTAKSPELARYFGGAPVSSGVTVNEHTAMGYSAVWAAVALISDDVASLPLMLYRKLPNGGKDKFETHPLYELLHDTPNPEMTSFVWRRTMQAHLSLWQNAYAEIERNAGNQPIAIWPLVPERVTKFRQNGLVRYKYANPTGGEVVYDDRDMLHLVGHSHDGSVGSSLVTQARESLGLGMAAERFGSTFFGNGSTFGGVIAYKGARPPELSDKEYVDKLKARHQGVERAHSLLSLYNDASYTPIGVPPNQAQFLETRVFQIREVARWFKIPPHKLADLADATFSNVEQQNIDYFTSCLRPLLALWEQELSRKLISRLERKQQFIGHVTQDLLAADAAGRSALYTAEFNVGAITPNEVRDFEGLDPIAGGDRAFVQLNMIPLDKVDAWVDAQIEKMKAPPAPVHVPPPVDPNAPTAQEKKGLEDALALSRHATQIAEDARDIAVAELGAVALALAGERDAHAATRSTLAMSDEALEQAQRVGKELVVRVEAITAERDGYEKKWEEASLILSDERSTHATAIAAIGVSLETAHEFGWKAEADRDAAMALATQADQEREAVVRQAAAIQQAVDVAESAAREARAEAEEATKLTTETQVGYRQALAERDAHIVLANQAADDLDSARLEVAAFQQTAEQAAAEAVSAVSRAGLAAIQADESEAQRKAIHVEREAALALVTQAVHDRDAAIAETAAQVTRAEAAESDAMMAEDTASTMTAQATLLSAERNALLAEAEALKTDVARARADIATEFERQRTHKTVLLAAMRSLFVDASERLLQREMDRSRKHQATPEKLRSWVASFYPLHADVCRSTFQPLVGPWTAITGGAPGVLLDRLVSEHIEMSTRALSLVADTDDPDDLAAGLERTLSRWEHERADTMADSLVREGMSE